MQLCMHALHSASAYAHIYAYAYAGAAAASRAGADTPQLRIPSLIRLMTGVPGMPNKIAVRAALGPRA